ncbi:MAG: hypothetical protein KJZ57_00245 [Anaerolineales bacterium]|nr:hypothetical protein [Anaerolineales bacterium]
MARWWRQALTFGAAGRVEKAWHEYEGVVQEARALAIQVEQLRVAANDRLEQLVRVKVASLPALKRIRKIARNLSARDRVYVPEIAGEEAPEVALAQVEDTLSAGMAALNAAKGMKAGASTALGAWALAQTFAAASTGTAISGLSGAAASSATLAWFGGGSLAAGGLGMAGGAAVLGGIVAVPTLGIMALLAHRQANRRIAEIEKESARLESAMDDMRKLELVVRIGVVEKSREAYDQEYFTTYRQLFPRGWFSKARRWARKRLWELSRGRWGGSYFREDEVRNIGKLLQIAAEFAKILDQRVFTHDGTVSETPT